MSGVLGGRQAIPRNQRQGHKEELGEVPAYNREAPILQVIQRVIQRVQITEQVSIE